MINISIKSNSMVIPSKPTPNGLLQLSEIDQAAQWTHAPVIHIYKPNNNIPSSFEKTKNANKMINISIKSNSMVIPSKPTPNGLLQLSEIDQAAQWTHAPVIHIYKPNNNIPSSFEKTKNAKEGGRLELDCNAMRVQVLEAYVDANLDDIGDFEPTGVVKDVVPKIDYTTAKSCQLCQEQRPAFVPGTIDKI
nr:shikimate o-hydroxycinnamoyltransferase [Quercus suber]